MSASGPTKNTSMRTERTIRSRQPATGPPGSYPDRTSTGRRRRAYEHEEHHELRHVSPPVLLGARKRLSELSVRIADAYRRPPLKSFVYTCMSECRPGLSRCPGLHWIQLRNNSRLAQSDLWALCRPAGRAARHRARRWQRSASFRARLPGSALRILLMLAVREGLTACPVARWQRNGPRTLPGRPEAWTGIGPPATTERSLAVADWELATRLMGRARPRRSGRHPALKGPIAG